MPTDTRRCPACKTRKPLDAFPRFGTRYRATCIACSDGKAPTPAPKAAPPRGFAGIEREAGFGFRASIEDGKLVIEQDTTGDDGETVTENVTLSRSEARELIDWIAEQVRARELNS
jgi:hypothetical protein